MKFSSKDFFLLSTRRGARAALTTLAATLTLAAHAQTDDFNDGDDMGWVQYDPRGAVDAAFNLGFGPQAMYEFPNGGYRIRTPVTTGLNGAAGPGRAGSLRTDVVYTDFYVSVDIVDWEDNTRQAFGLLARVRNPGPGMTDGFAFTYERGAAVSATSGDLDISILNRESPNQIEQGESGYHLDPAKDYRFVFIGRGPDIEARVYELPDVVNPVVRLTAFSEMHPSGFCGLVTYDNTGGMGVTDCTFDNYFATTIEPPRLFINYNSGFDEVVVSWLTNNGPFRLERTFDLIKPSTWMPVDESLIFPFGNTLQYTTNPENLQVFYRLVQD